MPTQNAEHGLYVMKRKQSAQSQFAYLMSSRANSELAEHDDVDLPFYSWNDTNNFFPPMHADSNYVPLGKGKPYCLHLDWIKID